ncbi:MAG: acyl carrier protein [Myxococcales bacterium]|nr:MAG: acyl carrier protein [Myxococcales bacterium]
MHSTTQDRRARITALIAEIAEVEENTLNNEARLREDLGMDSLSSMELLSTLSEELKLDIQMEDAMDIRTVDDACAFIESQYVSQHAELV